jgi:hypothetical protein
MDRGVAFARWVAQEAERRGLAVMHVDGTRSVAEGAAAVAAHFGWDQRAPAA